MKFGRILLTFVGFLIPVVSAAANTRDLEVSVLTSRAYIWSEPGFSWYDCRPGEKSFNPTNSDDKEAARRYPKSSAKKVCDSRSADDLFSSGQSIEVVTQLGRPVVSRAMKIRVGDEELYKKFYKVRNPRTGKEGWMSADQISDPRRKEFEVPEMTAKPQPAPPKKAKTEKETKPAPCPTNKVDENKEALKNGIRDAAKLNEAASKIVMGPIKSSKELDRYSCLYRSGDVSQSEFDSVLPVMRRTSEAAAKAFGIPAPILRCAMLVESGLKKKTRNGEGNFDGYAQVVSGTVAELKKVSKQNAYKDLWNQYTRSEPSAQLSDSSVRTSSDMASAMGAMALYLRYMQEEYVKSACTDCSSKNGMLSRKDIFLLITGYNGGQTNVIKAAKKSTAAMLTSYPPPEVTRNYLLSMSKCLEANHEQSFREGKHEIAQVNEVRKQQISMIDKAQSSALRAKMPDMNLVEKRKSRRSRLQRLISMNAAEEYEYQLNECDKRYPQ